MNVKHILFPEDDLEELAEQIRYTSKISRDKGKNAIIGIAGGSCTGKSSQISSELQNLLGSNVLSLAQDDYQLGNQLKVMDSIYRWDSPNNFGIKDAADALNILKNGGNVTIPVYSFKKRKRSGNKKVSPRPIIIFEGLYAGFEDISEVLDLLIYDEAPLYIRLIRRIFRNSFERYKSEPFLVLKHLISGGVFPAHRDLVIIQRKKAHYIIKIRNKLSEILTKYGFIYKLETNHLIKIVEEFQIEEEVCIRIMEDKEYALYFTIYESENCYFITSLDVETYNLLMQLNLFEL